MDADDPIESTKIASLFPKYGIFAKLEFNNSHLPRSTLYFPHPFEKEHSSFWHPNPTSRSNAIVYNRLIVAQAFDYTTAPSLYFPLLFRIRTATTLYSGHIASESCSSEVRLLTMISGKWKVVLNAPRWTSSATFSFISTSHLGTRTINSKLKNLTGSNILTFSIRKVTETNRQKEPWRGSIE